jgi:hypothetical protein
MRHDDFPEEVGWSLKRGSTTIMSQTTGSIIRADQIVNRTASLSSGTYTFRVTDSAADGLCCNYGPGYFVATLGGIPVLSGREYPGAVEATFRV